LTFNEMSERNAQRCLKRVPIAQTVRKRPPSQSVRKSPPCIDYPEM